MLRFIFLILLFSLNLYSQQTSNTFYSKNLLTVEVYEAPIGNASPQRARVTGLLMNPEDGIVLIPVAARVGGYRVRFFNGCEERAQFLYMDPWFQVAFLKINPLSIPSEIKKVSFRTTPLLPAERLCVGGVFQDTSHITYESGYFLYESMIKQWPGYRYYVTSNDSLSSCVKPGWIVFDSLGSIVGLSFVQHVMPITYIQKIISFLAKGKIPPRRRAGFVLDIISAENAFLGGVISQKMKNPLWIVRETHRGFLSRKYLIPGDILLTVNGKKSHNPEIISDIVDQSPLLSLTVIRKKRPLKLSINTKPIIWSHCFNVLSFSGLLCQEMDESAPFGQGVYIVGIDKTSKILKKQPYFTPKRILKLNGILIKTLDDLSQTILSANTLLVLEYVDGFLGIYLHPAAPQILTGKGQVRVSVLKNYKRQLDHPMRYLFDQKTLEWAQLPLFKIAN